MGALNLNETPPDDEPVSYVMLERDNKPICRTRCVNLPFEPPVQWKILEFQPKAKVLKLNLPHCQLYPEPQRSAERREWGIFTDWIRNHQKVGIVISKSCKFYILPPHQGQVLPHVKVCYHIYKAHFIPTSEEDHTSGDSMIVHRSLIGASPRRKNTEVSKRKENSVIWSPSKTDVNSLPCDYIEDCNSQSQTANHLEDSGQEIGGASMIVPRSLIGASPITKNTEVSKHKGNSQRTKNTEVSKHNENSQTRSSSKTDTNSFPCDYIEDCNSQSQTAKHLEDSGQKIHLNTNPSYLKTLGQAHAWTFGAIAELVDNSRDARATRLDILVELLYLRQSRKQVPVLSVIDDGHGMCHDEMIRMLSLGHGQPDEDDQDHIGRFGVGFKTGAMKLGKDAVVLTQTSTSRSVALFSQSFNENKDNMEIPVVSYCRHGNFMEIDLNIQSETCASNFLKFIKDFSPFNEYLIGEKFKLFGEHGTGTQIYIWNLDVWGSDYTLEWDATDSTLSAFHKSSGDILIRSRRLRSRPGQISQKVPLDYSLKAYLEVIFLDPRMKINVQGSLIKSRPLAKSLSRTVTVKGHVMGKPIQLTLGRSHEEWQRVNCGIFLYWHGRLIEAYKRVGGMVHNADMGRGVIGVVDVSNIMADGKGHVWVMNTKQGFQDCEAYARLEEWLGIRADEYWDTNFDTLDLKKGITKGKPDHDWVQCDKCRKWRMLSSGFDTESLPEDWFCYMPPFNGKCETPEQQMESGVVTVSAKRSRGNKDHVTIQCEETEVPDCSSSPPAVNNNTATQPICDRQWKEDHIDASPSGINNHFYTQTTCNRKRQTDQIDASSSRVNNRTDTQPTQPICNGPRKPEQIVAENKGSRSNTLHDKERPSANASLENCKNAGKGQGRDKLWKAGDESPPGPTLKRLRRGFSGNGDQT